VHYVAAFGGLPWTSAEQLVKVCPDSISCQTVNGDTPLHLLVANAKRNIEDRVRTGIPDDEHHGEHQNYCYFVDRQTTKLTELLIGTGDEEKSPLLIQNMEGLTPLHCCAVFNTPVQLTNILMDQRNTGYSRISSVLVSKSGSTALHLAVSSPTLSTKQTEDKALSRQQNAKANIAALATSQACAMFDASERTPLMLAVQNTKASSAIIKTLLDMCPESAKATTSKGFLPLHLACQNQNIKESTVKGTQERGLWHQGTQLWLGRV
jgi:hypothetical protein